MKSIAYIPGSNGAGNASQMTVQTLRSPGASDILVNTVTGVPTKFYGSTGAPHTFTDPVTNETITIISEATAVDFAGHIDTGKVVIDAIAPGYVDTRGSLVGDIVVVRPVTEWANNLFNILSQSHADDGTIKDDAINSVSMFADNVDPAIRDSEAGSDYIALNTGIWSALTGLNAAMTAATVYVGGYRGVIAAIASRAFTLNKDTYVDILRAGTTAAPTFTLVYTEVANSASAPALAANSIRIGLVRTNGTTVTNIYQAPSMSGGWGGFDNQGYPVYNTSPSSRIANRQAFISNSSTGASGSMVPWNGNSASVMRVKAGKTYRLTVHEPIIDGYTGTSGFIQLYVFLNSGNSGAYNTANQVGYMRDAVGAGGVGFDRTCEFTAPFTGVATLSIGFVCNGISGTLQMERATSYPATYTLEEVS